MYCYYELKVAKKGRFQFSAIEDNQNEGLPALANEGLVWKLSDEDMRQKPCDGFCTPPLPAYLVIKFDNEFHFIDYQKIITLKESGVKGLSHNDSYELSTKVLTV
jgi:hypothetical protein